MILNKYGVSIDNALDIANITIDAAVKNFLKDHPNITVLEMRAACQYLMATVDSAFTEQILIRVSQMRKKTKGETKCQDA